MIVAASALVIALAGTAIAGPTAFTSALNKREKRQAKRIAKNTILNLQGDLSVRNAGALDGINSTGFRRYGANIPSGATVTGVFGALDTDTGTPATQAVQSVSLPVPAPNGLRDDEVNFDDSTANSTADEADGAGCTGSFSSPTAPRGQVCLYLTDGSVAPNTAAGYALFGTDPSVGSRFGFTVAGDSATLAYLHGVWAYRAP